MAASSGHDGREGGSPATPLGATAYGIEVCGGGRRCCLFNSRAGAHNSVSVSYTPMQRHLDATVSADTDAMFQRMRGMEMRGREHYTESANYLSVRIPD